MCRMSAAQRRTSGSSNLPNSSKKSTVEAVLFFFLFPLMIRESYVAAAPKAPLGGQGELSICLYRQMD